MLTCSGKQSSKANLVESCVGVRFTTLLTIYLLRIGEIFQDKCEQYGFRQVFSQSDEAIQTILPRIV